MQARLVAAARPVAHEASGAAPEIGKVRHHRPQSIMLELQGHQQVKIPDMGEFDENQTEFDQDHEASLDQLPGTILNGSQLEGTDRNGSHLEELEDTHPLEDMEGTNHGVEVDDPLKREQQQQQVDAHETREDVRETEQQSDGNTSAKKSILRPDIEHPFKYADVAAKVDDMEGSEEKLRDHMDGVDKAWSKVDGDITGYDQSIKDLSAQFKTLRDAAHGIHTDVQNEFGAKEKKRMCSFMNADRVLNGQPEIDCEKI
jgi:hypothetical protein